LAAKHRLAWVEHAPYEHKRNCIMGEGKGPAFDASLSPLLLPGRERANSLKRADDALVGQTGWFESGAVEGIGNESALIIDRLRMGTLTILLASSD
jgi:hypothetical protein